MNLPRDLQIAYLIGRFGAVTVGDAWPVFWGSPHTARAGFGRLVRLRILRSFPRSAPSLPKWFALTPEGLAWVAEQSGCEEGELRAVGGIARANLPALSLRNRFWVSLILGSRGKSVRLALFHPEWELRRAYPTPASVVPDALVVLTDRSDLSGEGMSAAPESSYAYAVELDSGSERSQVWVQKARAYGSVRGAGPLYGERAWSVLALVPTVRRAQTVAQAVVRGGAGAFTLIGLAPELTDGRAFAPVLWRPAELLKSVVPAPRWSLAEAVVRSVKAR